MKRYFVSLISTKDNVKLEYLYIYIYIISNKKGAKRCTGDKIEEK